MKSGQPPNLTDDDDDDDEWHQAEEVAKLSRSYAGTI